MARRNLLSGLSDSDAPTPQRPSATAYAAHGASRSMLSSINELAAQAAKATTLAEGGAVVELDPALIDASFVSDRMQGGADEFDEFVNSIRERGQDTPILVRPHPTLPGRYQIVFGHRRRRAAEALGRPVRAIVKQLDDRAHIVAQGQENSARSNLTFIERAVFAQRLSDAGYDRATIQSALSVDAAFLTRMLSVTKRVPANILDAIGPSKVGRNRWLELATLATPAALSRAAGVLNEAAFTISSFDERFETFLGALKAKKSRKRSETLSARSWSADDGAVTAKVQDTGKTFSLALASKDGPRFGSWISRNLEELYRSFRLEDLKSGD